MARVKGREVVVDLLDAVAALEKTTALHATQLSELAALAVETSARVHGLTGHTALLARGFSDLSYRMEDMSKRMDDMSNRMGDMSNRMDDMSNRMDDMSSHMGGMSSHMGGMSSHMGGMSTRLNEHSTAIGVQATRTNDLTTQLVELEAGLTTQAENLLVAAKTVHQQQEQLGRVGRLLTTLASGNDDRFEEIEARLTVLEKKAS